MGFFLVRDINHQHSHRPDWSGRLGFVDRAPTCVAPGSIAGSFTSFVSQRQLVLYLVIQSGSLRTNLFVFPFRHVSHLPAQDGPDASHCFRSVVRDQEIKPFRSFHFECVPWLLLCVRVLGLNWGFVKIVDVFLMDAKVEDRNMVIDG